MSKLTFLVMIPLVLCRAQTSAADPQKAALEGHVTSTTGDPIKKVTLRLQQISAPSAAGVIQMPPAFSVQSDAQGSFVFENLDPGRYNLSADRPGYLRETYSSSGNNAITLTAGQRTTGIAFKMTLESAITGRVTDTDGDPVPRAQVTVYRVQYSNRGKQVLAIGSAQTQLDGTFRVERLSVGRFYVSAQDPQSMNLTVETTGANPKAPIEHQVATYYPSAIQISAATSINVAAGAETRGVEIRLAKARVFHIRGKVIDIVSGTSPSNARVNAVLNSGEFSPFAPQFPINSVVRDGTFDFGPLPAGEYILQSSATVTRAADGSVVTAGSVGRQIVNVGSGDVNDVVFRVGPGAEITGRISTEAGQQQPPAPGMNARPQILLTSLSRPNQGPSGVMAKDDGTFAIQGITPAVYAVQVVSMAQGSYVKSIRFGNQDITSGKLDLTSGAGAALDVVLSPNAADASGTLHGSDGTPLAGFFVTLWPAQPGLVDQARTNRTDANGAFVFKGLAPGDYRVAAWEQVDPGLLDAPEFRGKFDGKAAKVKLSENSHESVDAPLIGRDAIAAAAAELP